MSHRQLKTVQFDHTGGAGNDNLVDTIPAGVAFTTVEFFVENRGVASAFVIVQEDVGFIEDTVFEIPASGVTKLGDYKFDFIPILRSLAGANCFVTPVVRAA